MASARDRWCALPREVREALIAQHEVDAFDIVTEARQYPEAEEYPGEAALRAKARVIAAQLLRQAARREKKR